MTALQYQRRPVVDLSPVERRQMLELMQLCYDGVNETQFMEDLAAKHTVLLLHSRDGDLAGFSTMQITEETFQGRKVDVVYSGDTVIHPDHWGQKELQRAFGHTVVARKLSRPFRRTYWLLLSKGYKTYLLMTNNFPVGYPRRGGSPAGLREFAAQLASARWPDAWQPGPGLLRFTGNKDHVRSGVASIDAQTASHPDVAFFVANNPQYTRGDELVCVAELRFRDLFAALVRIARTQLKALISSTSSPRPKQIESEEISQ